ncbi:MAG: hypothetical protein R2911_09540 [Caldilineaceae bacterium]
MAVGRLGHQKPPVFDVQIFGAGAVFQYRGQRGQVELTEAVPVMQSMVQTPVPGF